MRHLSLLGVITLLASACAGQQPRASVQFLRPTATPEATIGQPTPTPEPVDVLVSISDVFQGGTILVSVTGPARAGEVTFRGRTTPLIRGDRSIFAFVGVAADDTPGISPLTVDFTLENGTDGQFVADINVLAVDWGVSYVDFDATRQDLVDPEVAVAEEQRLAAIYALLTPEKLWSGLWQFPVLGGITAPFGERRGVNGGPPRGHHSGVDFGATDGAEVLASNAGRVVFAGELVLHGKTVILDHGGGVFSTYSHLGTIAVAEGQRVSGGEAVGTVGNTGRSTAPHLHWEMSVGGILVDPVRFADGSNGF